MGQKDEGGPTGRGEGVQIKYEKRKSKDPKLVRRKIVWAEGCGRSEGSGRKNNKTKAGGVKGTKAAAFFRGG